jgi:DNA-binding MarR family transcriptional regulator
VGIHPLRTVRGLLVRKSTPGDRRTRLVELTRDGKPVAASYFEKHARELRGSYAVLSAPEKRQLYASLKKLGLLAAKKLEKEKSIIA